jgi:hypothetical protein
LSSCIRLDVNNNNCTEQFVGLFYEFNATVLVLFGCLESCLSATAGIDQGIFTLICSKRDFVVFDIACKTGSWSPLARISRVFTETVKHVMTLFSRISASVGRVGILERRRTPAMPAIYSLQPYAYICTIPLGAVYLRISNPKSRM